MSTEKTINEATKPACFLGAVMPSFLIHPYAQVCGCGKPALHYYEPFNEWFCDKCDKFKITIIGEIVDHALYGC